MSETFTDAHFLRGAFVANLLGRLGDLIVDQGEDLLEDAGLTFPPRAVSCVLLIGERGQISASDIAQELNQPHQLVTQRIELLIELSVVKRVGDPRDGRRKILTLTGKGRQQFKRLQTLLADSDRAFKDLFAEIECDLHAAATRAMAALIKRPVLDRVRAVGQLPFPQKGP